jgi:two-component system CheB/CheR fusion protein
VVDGNRRVRMWNQRAEDLWGLREDEVRGEDILNLDIGLPVRRLEEALDASLGRGIAPPDLTVQAINRRGRTVSCELSITPLRERDGVTGAIVLMQVVADA